MSSHNLVIRTIKSQDLSAIEKTGILTLCSQAFRRDYGPYLESFPEATHVLGYIGQRLVSQALWITRWLEYSSLHLLRTAYGEGVATNIDFRNLGVASAVPAYGRNPRFRSGCVIHIFTGFLSSTGMERLKWSPVYPH
jgi:hypothetical protein